MRLALAALLHVLVLTQAASPLTPTRSSCAAAVQQYYDAQAEARSRSDAGILERRGESAADARGVSRGLRPAGEDTFTVDVQAVQIRESTCASASSPSGCA